MSKHTLPKRSDVARNDTWDLESVYPNLSAWEADFAKVTALLPKMAEFKGEFTKSGDKLLSALKLRDEIGRTFGKLSAFANMRLHEDTTVAAHQSLTGRVGTLGVQLSSTMSFMTPELLALPSATLAEFVAGTSGLSLYQKEFDDLERDRPHTLSTEMEQLLAQAGEMAQVPDGTFEMLNNADLKLPKVKDESGRLVQLSQGNYGARFLESRKAGVRKAAFDAMFGTYNGLRNTFASLYSGQVKANMFYAKARKHRSSLEAALSGNRIPTSVYDNLLNTVDANLPKLHRYLRLRKKLLRMKNLRICDLYVPMVAGVDYEIGFEEAKEKCLAALAPLGPEYVSALRKGFEARWVDVRENQGKRSGAYSWGSYDTAPFMLLNWQDSMDSMFTLIHESGHSMHSFYTRKNQPYCYGNYTIFVAEVASICNEMLLTHYLLENTTDKALRMYIINHALDGFRATLFRQTLFAEFEKQAHAHAEAGEALTPELLCSIYKKLNEKYYGDVVKLDDLIEIEWARIPHFYSSFYVYQYATGLSAAVALSQQIIKEGKPAVERYLRF
ncbi:MAG: oligoendopeptidase F, partial [Candidatus Obscuribacterales bacterium]|nr:oligoendopeptidase F [Candidatus Obscuribacterales bacterium]